MRKLLWTLPGILSAILFFLPLSWVAPFFIPTSVTTSQTDYQGTVWRGQIRDLRDIESVNYHLNPMKVLRGGRPVRVELRSPGLLVNGQASRQNAEGINFRINVASLPLPDPRLRGLAGQITAQIDQLSWTRDGSCREADGTVQSDVLTRNDSLFAWVGPNLSGTVSCTEEGRYVFALSGRDDLQTIRANVSVASQGSYQADLAVITQDADAAEVLPLFGFEARGESADGKEFRLVEQGNWR